MNLVSCNPYIRFADLVRFVSKRGPSKTYDCRLLYTTEGSALLTMEGVSYPLIPGSLVIFQPGTQYQILLQESVTMMILDFDYTQDFSHISDILLPAPADDFQPEQSHGNLTFEDAPIFSDPFYMENASFLINSLLAIAKEYRQKQLYYCGKASTLLHTALFDIMRYSQLGFHRNEAIEILLDYIESNLHQNLTNQAIGEALNYSPNYLSRLIQQHTGQSLHQYLLKRRVRRAMILLQSTDQSITEIALSLGFGSLSHFSNFFRRETGITPGEFRKKGSI